jgi:hypothetical protein
MWPTAPTSPLLSNASTGHHRVVDVQRQELVELGQQRHAVRRLRVRRRVEHPDEVDTVERAEHAGVVPSHRTQPDQARAQATGNRAHTATATALTASTIRSS